MNSSPCNGSACYAFNNAPRCGAKSRRNNGRPCRAPAVRGKRVCRMHGGGKGSGGQRANQNRLVHGRYTKEAKALRRNIKEILRESKEIISLYRD